MPGTVLRSIRVDKDLDAWFNEVLPWRGTLPQFLNACLAEFRKQWGDRPTPHQAVSSVIESVVRERY